MRVFIKALPEFDTSAEDLIRDLGNRRYSIHSDLQRSKSNSSNTNNKDLQLEERKNTSVESFDRVKERCDIKFDTRGSSESLRAFRTSFR